MGGTPSQPERWAAISRHLADDRDQGELTLRGPDLAYYLAFARPGDDLRDWVMAALDERIAVTERDQRSDGVPDRSRHICGSCRGHGCPACDDSGFVCPFCRGVRWLTGGRAAGLDAELVRCLSCTEPMLPGDRRAHSPTRERWAIQRYLQGLDE